MLRTRSVDKFGAPTVQLTFNNQCRTKVLDIESVSNIGSNFEKICRILAKNDG
jgi:hypothetical protein